MLGVVELASALGGREHYPRSGAPVEPRINRLKPEAVSDCDRWAKAILHHAYRKPIAGAAVRYRISKVRDRRRSVAWKWG
jgi:hypothetical protein